jgi:hypothetical protein
MLQGQKSYLVAILIAVITFVYAMGWINNTVYTTIVGILAAGGLAALRSAITTEAIKI